MDANETTISRHLTFEQNLELLGAMCNALGGSREPDKLRVGGGNSGGQLHHKASNDPLYKHASTGMQAEHKKGVPPSEGSTPKAQC